MRHKKENKQEGRNIKQEYVTCDKTKKGKLHAF